ncbi:hypothetical protein [Spiroplasma sp. ChiS]|uniref:hypothetical protein n=1 Tax=Spiroplasma sp. ChiS TaxID=2099885 RepID=UPI0011BACD0D|nr:hypothetical protein [Spiroplasma sp. ChiS]
MYYSLFYLERKTTIKKLLSILTITTLTASIPAPLLANKTLIRVKRDVGMSKSNKVYVPIKEKNGITGKINSLAVDSKDNIYFRTNNK